MNFAQVLLNLEILSQIKENDKNFYTNTSR